MVKLILRDCESVVKIVKTDLVALITNGAAEAAKIKKQFKEVETELVRNGAKVASMLDGVADSSRKEAEGAMSALKTTQRSTFLNGMALFFAALIVIVPCVLLIATK